MNSPSTKSRDIDRVSASAWYMAALIYLYRYIFMWVGGFDDVYKGHEYEVERTTAPLFPPSRVDAVTANYGLLKFISFNS